MLENTSSTDLSKRVLYGIGVLIVICIFALAFYFYRQNQKAQTLLQNPQEVAKAEIERVVVKVEELMILPNETPNLATVTDREKLKDEIFFKNAQKGDKVLIYLKDKKAILYRPSTNRIIEVTPLP